ncbi:MAG TPA: DNA repair protein RecN [Burkholderiaceae bacterium]|nr:DNA repair protein RecN [Burkholderiaceae bacterium]
MLLSLAIRDFVIVDALELDLAPGYTALTGETGAGKSILIDALQLALGERAEADVVREGAPRAEVSAEFRVHPAAAAWLEEAGIAAQDTVLVRRVVEAGGRSRAWINGSAAALAQLRELGELLVDVHGQHAHQSLLRPAAQLALLDEHGGLGAQTAELGALWADWRRALRAREAAQQMAQAALAEQDRLRWTVEELGELAPGAGEWEAVQAEHRRLAHGASLLEGAQAAIDALAEADGAALVQVDTVIARLTQLAQFDERLAPIVDSLEAARIQIDDAAGELARYLDRTELDAGRLAELDARLSALHAAARKFRCEPGALAGLLGEARERLTALTAASDLEGLARAEAEAQARYRAAAQSLGRARQAAARHMSEQVSRAMQDLAMAGGRFEVALAEAEPASQGLERAEFLVAGHAGVAPKPLAKVASGGELARVSLAISVIAATATPVGTLIFDEVDAGIGGAVAETVGRLLHELGRTRQVLCVTHLPQVAARADQHLLVAKQVLGAGAPVSRIEALDRKSRVEEIARMLGGQTITETTRKHARQMLAG